MTTNEHLLNELETNASAHLRGYPLARRITAQQLIDAVECIREQDTAIAELVEALDSLRNLTARDAARVATLLAKHKAGK